MNPLQQLGCGFGFGVFGAPVFGEFAIEGLFEEGLAIDAELPPRPAQALLPGVQLAEQLLDLRDDPMLLGEGREWDGVIENVNLRKSWNVAFRFCNYLSDREAKR